MPSVLTREQWTPGMLAPSGRPIPPPPPPLAAKRVPPVAEKPKPVATPTGSETTPRSAKNLGNRGKPPKKHKPGDQIGSGLSKGQRLRRNRRLRAMGLQVPGSDT